MISRVKVKARRFAGSLCLSFAILAIANVETIWNEYRHTDPQDAGLLMKSVSGKKAAVKMALAPASRPGTFKPLQSELSQSLEQDEFIDGNPFAHLATLDPLHQIMSRGVSRFHRETYRSPDYHDESGYDMVHYEIEHPDGRNSVVLAYLDRGIAGVHEIGAPDQGVPVVIFLVAMDGEEVSYAVFRASQAVEQTKLPTAKAQELVAQRLSEGVPFLSVSR
jgi:hypothetical protein